MAEFLERAQPWFATLVAHNWPVLIYLTVAAGAAVWAVLFPARQSVLFLYGACLLVIAYEYEKHGRTPILDTTGYLFSLETNAAARTMSRWLLLEVTPLLMQVSGFGLLAGSFALHRRALRKTSRPFVSAARTTRPSLSQDALGNRLGSQYEL